MNTLRANYIRDQIIPGNNRIVVVIPCYRVTGYILDVIAGIGNEICQIYIIDDACPDGSGKLVEARCSDQRVRVIYHSVNQGVGAAVMSGYQSAIADGADVIVKIDGDGQMDPSLILNFVNPILSGEADYTKGNRFFDLEEIRVMPKIRVFGNAVLSLMAKLSTGYWDVFDPTNGFTAIHADVAKHLPLSKISRSYFFETDMLFRLNTLRAVVICIPMTAKYGNEISNLKISKIVGEFFVKHVRNLFKRVFYNYYLRDLSLASIELPLGIILFMGGSIFGGYHWFESAMHGIKTPIGTVMLAALPILIGLQFILAFLGYDIASVPRRPIHKDLRSQSILIFRRKNETCY